MLHEVFRRCGYSERTEESYTHWIFEFVKFHERRPPREMGSDECVEFLNHLAVVRQLAPSTLNQALCSVVFLYNKVYEREMPELEGLQRSKRPVLKPEVVTRDEAMRIFARMEWPAKLGACWSNRFVARVRRLEQLASAPTATDRAVAELRRPRERGGKPQDAEHAKPQ